MKGRSSTPSVLYTNTVNLSCATSVGGDPEPYGAHTISIGSSPAGFSITLNVSGQVPTISQRITNSMVWHFQNSVYVYLTDTDRHQWLLQFPDATEAAKATVLVSLLLSNPDFSQTSFYEPVAFAGRKLKVGDGAQFSYYIFPVGDPPIGPLFQSSQKQRTRLIPSKIPSGWLSGIEGMTQGTSRVIFVPKELQYLEDGQHDSRFPNSNAAVITTIVLSKFHEESPINDAVQTPTPQQVPGPTVEPTTQPSKQPKKVEEPTVNMEVVEEHLSKMESMISSKLDNLRTEKPIQTETIIRNVSQMATKLRESQKEIESLKRQLEEAVQNKANTVSSSQLERATRDAEFYKLKLEQTERRIQDIEALNRRRMEEEQENKERARQRVITIVKSMMSRVFDEIRTDISSEGSYLGSEVSEKLYTLLRRHSFEALEEINSGDLF